MTPISLASGYGHFAVPAAATARVQALLARPHLPISPTEGLPVLRQALATRYHGRQAPSVQPAHIVVTPGTKTALSLVLRAVLQPEPGAADGPEVLLLTPNWFGFAELVRQAGGTLRTLPLSPTDDYALHPEIIRAALTPRTRVLLLSNPNNPTGRVYTRPELAALLAVTAQFPQLLVLSDEIYDGIWFGPEPVPTLLSFPDPHQQHVVVNGFSKSQGLIGWNIGYLVAPTALAQACAAQLFTTGGAAAVLSQAAALPTAEQADISADLCRQLAPTRRLLLDFLADRPGTLPHLPLGTYYAFPDLRAYLLPGLAPAEASAHLVARLLAAGVAVVDGATCGLPGFVRLSYAVPESDLREALRRLAPELRIST